ncbi:NfeD family protein [Chlamydiota bacterium]
MLKNLWWLWILAASFFVITEIFTPTFFLFWFGIGALIAALFCVFNFGIIWQWSSFIITSFILLLLSRKFADRVSGKQPPGIGANRIIGKTAQVIEEINPKNDEGRVKINGDEWRAKSIDNTIIEKGESVTILSIDGTKAIVKKI